MLRKLSTFALLAMATSASVGRTQEPADDRNQTQIQVGDGNPQGCVTDGPQIGMMAIDTYAGVEVTSTMWNSPAQRLGLEPGDRVIQVNGHRVRTTADLKAYLKEAVQFHQGQITVIVDNVRARLGAPGVQRYVTVRTFLDGYYNQGNSLVGPVFPSPGPQPIPVPVAF
ncbi:MAG: PDZ domain-containing protein [Pirellulaceae bacterium]|jgi:C-terminal processing protease CtpA/Prc|nr:PDZ domain-containing protein [Pirellulaceae bacterium]